MATRTTNGLEKATGQAEGPLPQRKCACGAYSHGERECTACRQRALRRQRKPVQRAADPEAPPIVRDVLRSPGQPLDSQTKGFLESRIPPDFTRIRTHSSGAGLRIGSPDSPQEREAERIADSIGVSSSRGTPAREAAGVRVHTDAHAAESARAVNAHAYTAGQHIVFGAGAYQPRSAAGQRLIAHEFAHVQQQSGRTAVVQRVSFFENIARFFGGGTFSSEELETYLKFLEGGKIEDAFDSDNKAREVVRLRLFEGKSSAIRILLIKEMLSGFTGDDDEQAILEILRAAPPEERTAMAERIGLDDLWDNFHGAELDELYAMFPILNQMHPRGPEQRNTQSVEDYIRRWEAEHGRSMTAAERITLAKGCVGITMLNLGTSGAPDLSNCYGTFAQAYEAQKNMDDFLRAHFPDRKARIFSKRFWSGNRDFTPDPTTGKVDMSGDTSTARPGFVNFDYGFWDEATGRWWHANHCDPATSPAGGECRRVYDVSNRMKVYESNLQSYSTALQDFDTQVFCVAVSTLR
jgi:hypothetical protein